jgi:hypothetical protein
VKITDYAGKLFDEMLEKGHLKFVVEITAVRLREISWVM